MKPRTKTILQASSLFLFLFLTVTPQVSYAGRLDALLKSGQKVYEKMEEFDRKLKEISESLQDLAEEERDRQDRCINNSINRYIGFQSPAVSREDHRAIEINQYMLAEDIAFCLGHASTSELSCEEHGFVSEKSCYADALVEACYTPYERVYELGWEGALSSCDFDEETVLSQCRTLSHFIEDACSAREEIQKTEADIIRHVYDLISRY